MQQVLAQDVNLRGREFYIAGPSTGQATNEIYAAAGAGSGWNVILGDENFTMEGKSSIHHHTRTACVLVAL
jgi:hypothetical protein